LAGRSGISGSDLSAQGALIPDDPVFVVSGASDTATVIGMTRT
jgi:hypothetical protein